MRQGKDDGSERREDGQWELRVTRGGMPGKVVACATKDLSKTNMVALGAKGRAGALIGKQRNLKKNLGTWSGRNGRMWFRSRDRNSDTQVPSGEVASWSLQQGISSPACLMGVVCTTWKLNSIFFKGFFVEM